MYYIVYMHTISNYNIRVYFIQRRPSLSTVQGWSTNVAKWLYSTFVYWITQYYNNVVQVQYFVSSKDKNVLPNTVLLYGYFSDVNNNDTFLTILPMNKICIGVVIYENDADLK